MRLTPREKDKLMVSLAADVARKRLNRGVKLNHPEVIALISDFVLEGARDGKTVSELMASGAKIISKSQVMDGVDSMIHDIQVEQYTIQSGRVNNETRGVFIKKR